MGFLSKAVKGIGKAVGNVVKGVGKVFKKVGGWVKDALGNEWVQKALMAAAIVTGGIAIANGVMVGFQQASAAQGFLGKFMAGADGFITGMKAGLMNPIQTAGGIKDTIMGTAQAASGAAEGASAATGLLDTAQQAATANTTPVGTAVANIDPGLAAEMSKTFEVGQFGGMGQAPGLESVIPSATDALGSQLVQQQASPGWLQSLKKGVTSPIGMLALSNAVQGYAAGAAREKELDRIDRQENIRRESFEGFADTAQPIPSLRDLPRMRKDVLESRDDVSSRYRYGAGR